MRKDSNIPDQNSRWLARSQKKPVKDKIKHHPWTHTDRLVKQTHEKLWVDVITPENQAVEKSKDPKVKS